MGKLSLNQPQKYHQGYYHLNNPEKYKGKSNEIFYRSSWEFKFMKYCDLNPAVVAWASEEIIIPYFYPLDEKIHQYHIDFWIKLKTDDGITQFLVEIKPKDSLIRPVLNEKNGITQTKLKNYRYSMLEFIKNQAKWKAAKEYGRINNCKFIIITEDHLKNI